MFKFIPLLCLITNQLNNHTSTSFTGGGFSTYNPTPSWQQSAVDGYFAGLTTAQIPTSGYNVHGRAYPDVSMIGVWYQIVAQGEWCV